MTSKTFRIAYARFMHETNSFSTVPTTQQDFERTHYFEGEELAKVCQNDVWEVKGYLKNLELSGFLKAVKQRTDLSVDTIPLLSSWSIPGGPVTKEYLELITHRIKEKLSQAGEVDAVYISLHGAMGVEGVLDPEAHLLSSIREVIGSDKYLVASFDLHGLMTKEKMDMLDFACAYRTNPHWDFASTGQRVGKILLSALAGEVKPVMTWRSLPILLGGGNTLSFWPPMRSVFQRMNKMEEDSRVLDCSVFMCHPYLKHPDMGWSIISITDGNKPLAEQLADELAERCWEKRLNQPPEFLSVAQAVKKIRSVKIRRKLGAVAIADTSDVVGAGATGENTTLIKELLAEAPDLRILCPLRDPQVVNEIWDKFTGDKVEVSLGGKLQPDVNPPLKVTGTLRSKHDTESFDKVIVLDIEGMSLVITEGYALPIKPTFYEDLGLDVKSSDIVVVKNFFHFRIYYATKAFMNIYVKTQGITDFDVALQLETNYPVHPRDSVDDWKEIDRKKRGLSPEEYRRSEPNFKLESKNHQTYVYLFLIALAMMMWFSRKK